MLPLPTPVPGPLLQQLQIDKYVAVTSAFYFVF